MSNTNLEAFFAIIISLLGSALNYIIPLLIIIFLVWLIPWLIKETIIAAIKESAISNESYSYLHKLDKIIDRLDSINSKLENTDYLKELNWWKSEKEATFATVILREIREIERSIREMK